MTKKEVENKIKERFNKLSNIFPENIEKDDPRVQAILKFLGDIEGKKILDVGCGKGRFSKILVDKKAVVTGIDLSDKLLEVAKKNIEDVNFVIGSTTNLKFQDNLFDCIICIETLEHVPDTKKAVEEMLRVLKEGGKIIIIDKNKLSLHDKLFLPNIFIKKYKELSNKWMYPKNFPFIEKWFFPIEIEKMLSRYCRETKKE